MSNETNTVSLEEYLRNKRTRKPTTIAKWDWEAYSIPVPVTEYRFCKTRKWLLDFAWVTQKVGIEIQGLTKAGGAHQRFAGYLRDCEKHNWLIENGWRILNYVPKHIDFEQVARVLGRP